MKHLTLKRSLTINGTLFSILLLTALLCLSYGSESTSHDIIIYSRLPRILLGMLVGMALGSGGTAFQALLRNPLADPYILGISGGAALGSTIGLAAGLPFPLIVIVAFTSSLASLFLIFWTSRFHGRFPPHTLLLTGVIFNAFAFAFIMLIHSLVTMEQAHEILFMLIGNLEVHDYRTIAGVAFFVLTGLFILNLLSPKMNAIAIGDETAQNLGINTDKTRKLVFFAASLQIGAVVSIAGLIGFVGLFIPHTARLIFGSDHRLTIPASAFMGGTFLIFADTIARTLLMRGEYQTQLPVGVITALIGGPVFVYLLKRQMK